MPTFAAALAPVLLVAAMPQASEASPARPPAAPMVVPPAPVQRSADTPLTPIVVDGAFDDWKGRTPAVVDPVDAEGAAVDLGRVVIDDDPEFVHFLIELGRPVNLQGLDGSLHLLLDADGDAATGVDAHGLHGVDLGVVFTPADARTPGRPGRGVAVRRLGEPAEELSPYLVGVVFAPTAAADRAEVRLTRGLPAGGGAGAAEGPPLFTGPEISGKLVFFDRAGAVRDQTDPFRHVMVHPAAPRLVADTPVDPLARAEGAELRVVSWNVQRSAMFRSPERFGRILRAVAPDVLLLQELTKDDSADRIAAWLDEHVPSAADAPASPWNVAFARGGGDLRTAVATRLPLTPVPGLDRVFWQDERGKDRDVRFVGATVAVDGRTLLCGSMHLKCCGSAGGEEDHTRLEEVQAVRSAVRRRLAPSAAGSSRSAAEGGAGVGGVAERDGARLIRADGLLLAGDFNLVGAFEPLNLAVEGLDLDGSDLLLAECLQPDGRVAATWADTMQPFTPGRLDFLLFSDSALQQCGGFVLDTADLGPGWLERHGLLADDSSASDHLPLVVDLRWRRSG